MMFLVKFILIVDLIILVCGIIQYGSNPQKWQENARIANLSIDSKRATSLWKWNIGDMKKE